MPGDTPFDAALAALDVEHYVTEHGWRSNILGLDAVRAAHRAEVERAVADERAACARILRAFREQSEPGDDVRLTLEQAEQDICARGVAKQRTGSEAPSASDEGAKS